MPPSSHSAVFSQSLSFNSKAKRSEAKEEMKIRRDCWTCLENHYGIANVRSTWGPHMAPFQFRQLVGLLLCVRFAWCELGRFGIIFWKISEVCINLSVPFNRWKWCQNHGNSTFCQKCLGLNFQLGPKILDRAEFSAWMHSDHYYGLRIS